jgi:hypothetical protein
MQEPPINDFLRDDMLLKVMDSNPWYANIVNFMVSRYVPPGENKKKLIFESRRHLCDDPYLYRVCTDGLLRRCVPVAEGIQIIEKCHTQHTKATLEHSGLKQKFGKVVSSGRQCMKTPENSFEDFENARCKVASLLATQCPSHITFRLNYSMYEALTSWGHSRSPMIASTSWSLWTTYPSGWKHFCAELPCQACPQDVP